MRFRKCAVVLCAACLASASASARANELVNVYERALASDTTLQAAMHARDAALESRPIARAALLPQLDSAYSYQKGRASGHSSFPIQSQIPNPADPGGPPLVIDEISRDEFDDPTKQKLLTVTLSQTVFDWAVFKRYDQAGAQVALAQAQYRNAEQSLVLRAAQAYFDYLAASDSLRFSRAEKEAVERQLEQARRRFEVGLSAITDVQEAQARYDLTVAQEIQADQLLSNAEQAVLVITGPGSPKLTELRDEIPLVPPNPPLVDSWVTAAGANNLDLVIAGLQEDVADRDIRVAQAGHLPTVGLQAQYQDSYQSRGENVTSFDGPGVAVEVKLPIFSGFGTQSRVDQAGALRDQRKSEREGVARNVERQTRDAYLGVMAGAARVKALNQAVLSNNTALEASETGLEVGTRTAVDVLNAQSLLYSAQRDYARSRYDYLLSVLRLKAASGRLTGKDLDEIDALLKS